MGSTKTTSAIVVVALTVAAAVYTLVAGNQPLLGLDLQGGVSVVLQPSSVVDPDTGEERDIDEEALDQTVEIIRSRVDALGVAEPEISRQGETIVVALPGVEEQQRALELVGQTAELRFRPLLFELPPEFLLDPEQDVDGESDGDEPASDESETESESDGEEPASDESESESDGDEPASDGESDEEEESMAVSGRFAALQDTTSTTADEADTSTTADESEEADTSTTADEAEESDTSTTADDNDGDTEETVVGEDGTNDGDDEGTVVPPTEQSTLDPAELAIIEACSISGVTPPEEDFADRPVVLVNDLGNRLCLGPTLLTGDALETAGVSLDPAGQWTVNPTFRSGVDGIDLFNEAAALCFNGSPMCPPQQGGPGRLAIVLDNEVVSYPSINAEIFGRDQIVISGAFMEDDARDLASVLRFGALPLELETQQTRTVSATIGDDVLRSGVIAGLIGLALVAIYLLSYYRLAGLVAIAGLVISAVLLWAIISWFGENLGLALTLAGVVGLIVSVGVSADSNIVYFENVKDSYRGGRKIPTAVERAYQTAISTIVKADVVSLIAAALLYLLTVGAVRGFAFYLGLATLLDLFISWLFMRPALAFLARRQAVEKNPRLLGLPATGGDQ